MRALLIEENAFVAFDLQNKFNKIGIFSLRLFSTVEESLRGVDPSVSQFDLAILRQSEKPLSDLGNIWQLRHTLKICHIVLIGIYAHSEEILLRSTAKTMQLPLSDIVPFSIREDRFQSIIDNK